MAINLALLSGKGGSGKTTLALSLAQLLALCKKRVLLIDCDMSTHGATYFFEDVLGEKDHFFTFADMIMDDKNSAGESNDKVFFNLEPFPHLHFMPSCAKFPFSFDYDLKSDEKSRIRFKELAQSYDVVIFDCQAGYNNINEFILELSDKNLLVLEPDAVSVISVRVLYSQCLTQLNEKKTYQVFSKVLPEEYEPYKNIPHGTFFPNLDPISFDFSVRAAFSSCTIPEINENNPRLTDEICGLAISLFPTFKMDLQKYMFSVKKTLLKLTETKTLKILTERKKKFNEKIVFMLIPTVSLVFSIFFLIYISIKYISIKEIYGDMYFAFWCGLVAVLSSFIYYIIKKRESTNIITSKYDWVLDQQKLKREIENLYSILYQKQDDM